MEISPSIYARWEILPFLQPPLPAHVHGGEEELNFTRQLCGSQKRTRWRVAGLGEYFPPGFLPRFLAAYCPTSFEHEERLSLISKVFLFHLLMQQILIEAPTRYQALFWAWKGAQLLLLTRFLHVCRPPGSKTWLFCSKLSISFSPHLTAVLILGWPIVKPWFGWLRNLPALEPFMAAVDLGPSFIYIHVLPLAFLEL